MSNDSACVTSQLQTFQDYQRGCTNAFKSTKPLCGIPVYGVLLNADDSPVEDRQSGIRQRQPLRTNIATSFTQWPETGYYDVIVRCHSN